jgi:hypothetical protein
MTYCVGWRSGRTAFLIADAASSTPFGGTPSSPTSTFGEWHKEDKNLTVEETSFKLFRWKNLALTCAGHSRPIREFVRTTDDGIARGLPPWVACAYSRSKQRLRPTESFEAVLAFNLFGRVRLFRLDAQGTWHWVERDAAVHLGSASQNNKEFVNGAIADTLRANQDPTAQIASVLAACQSLTVHNDLLAEGVGGAFSGVMVDSDGTRWQPDMGYLLLNPPDMQGIDADVPVETRNTLYITCAIRDDILFVSSPEKSGTIAFLSTKQDLPNTDVVAAVKRASESAKLVRARCFFPFIAVISKQWPQTALVQMHNRSTSADLKLIYEIVDNREKLTVLMSRRVGEILRGERAEPLRPRVYICPTEP